MPPYNSLTSIGVSYTGDQITPDNDVVFEPTYRWIDIIIGGDFHFLDGKGVEKTWQDLPDGYAVKCLVTKIFEDSTASGFIGYP